MFVQSNRTTMTKEIARSRSQMKIASVRMSLPVSVAAILAVAFAVASGEACAGTTTWSGGGGNANWSTSSNWSTLPTTSGTWSLVFGGTTQTTNTNNIGPITVDSLTFGNNGTVGRNANFTLSGSTLALSSATITTTATTSGSALTDSVGNALSLTGSNTASIGSGHNLTIAGNIDGAGSLTMSGAGQLFLTGSNSQSGATYITGGSVRTGSGGSSTDSNNYAFGTGDVVVSGSGTLAIRNSSTVANNLTIGGVGSSASTGSLAGSFAAANQTAVVSGSVTLATDSLISTWGGNVGTGSKLSLTGPINLGSNALTFSQVVTGTTVRSVTAPMTWIEVGGAISGAGSVIVNGTATVYLNGANTYSGTTTVQSGVLGGNGTIAGAVTVQNGAFLTPGSAANTTGALGVGSLQLDSGATAAMAISGTAAGLYDQVVALGNVNYGGNLAIDFTTASFANFDVWQLFSGTSFSGNFSSVTATGSFGNLTFNDLGTGEWQATGGSLGAGQSLSFYVDNTHAIGDRYKAGQLVVVPEPSTIVFAGIGLFVLGWRRLAKRRRAAQSSVESIAAV